MNPIVPFIIIVLGYPANDDGSLTPILESRIKYAVELYDSLDHAVLILSGSAVMNGVTEAQAMANYALSHGVPSDSMILEDSSLNTYQNSLRVKEHIDGLHDHSDIYLVTSKFHIDRAMYYFTSVGLNVIPKPCPDPEGYGWWDQMRNSVIESILLQLAKTNAGKDMSPGNHVPKWFMKLIGRDN